MELYETIEWYKDIIDEKITEEILLLFNGIIKTVIINKRYGKYLW